MSGTSRHWDEAAALLAKTKSQPNDVRPTH